MEATFYEDFHGMSLKNKRPATLGLNAAPKRQKQAFFLSSPDLDMLKMTTPEIERFIVANCSLVKTPTPSGHIVIPKSLMEGQENNAKGFIDALNQLHQLPSGHQDNVNRLYSGLLPIYITSPGMNSVLTSPKYSPSVLTSWNPSTVRLPSVEDTNSSCSNSSFTSSRCSNSSFTNSSFTNSSCTNSSCSNSSCTNSNSMPVELQTKEELQTVPSGFSSPPPTSIDPEDQQKIKLERKRYRNRIAASKCRQRKLDKISQLEDKVKELEGENAKLLQQVCHFKDLERENANLREQLCHLKDTVLDHQKKGCKIMNLHHPL